VLVGLELEEGQEVEEKGTFFPIFSLNIKVKI
jgi:hypothetical protein